MAEKILNKKYVLAAVFSAFFLLIVFVIFAYFKISFNGRRLTKLNLSSRGRFADLVVPARRPLADVTPVLPIVTPTITPTPTLTPVQIAEIRRKQFEELNKKFGPCKYVPILMYHHVMTSSEAKAIAATGLNVPPDIFRQQLDYLAGKGYQVIGLDEMVEKIRSNSLPVKPVVLTFDDGYRDFYNYVYPILKERGIKATVFVISQFVGGERYLVWAQVREMANSGLVLIGNHTLNHLSLPKLSKEEAFNQIISAKVIIEENIGKKVEYFAYPYGGYNSQSEQILKENAFLGAVITTNVNPQCSGLPYELSRIRIGASFLSRYGL